MHYYVYQFFNEPHPQTDWVPEWFFTEQPTFFPVADTIVAVEKRAEVIRMFGLWLEENRLGTLSQDGFTLTPDACTRYFKNRFGAFKKAAAALQNISETQFASNHHMIENRLAELNNSFCNVLGDYVLSGNKGEPISMDQFIRTAAPGQPYYFGAVMDYK